MMNYEAFKKEVEERFISYLPDEMKNMKVEFCQVNKVNRTLDGIRVFCKNTTWKIAPTIYINEMYDLYQKNESFEEALFIAVLNMSQVVQEIQTNTNINLDMSTAKDNIIFRVINTKQNSRLLENVPNRPFLDLSVIYCWIVRMGEDGFQSTVVNNRLAQSLELTEEDMFKLAVENTRRILPPMVKELGDMIRKFLSPEFTDIPIWNSGNDIWAITNARWIEGAGCILYEDELYALAESLESDLYILPSSIHEMLAIPAEGDADKLSEIVAFVNMKDLALEERLSNQVYRYDRKLRKLSLATDTSNKNLDKLNE